MNTGRLFVGAALVGVGVVYLLDAGGALHAGATLASWWPVLIVALGVFHALDRGRMAPGAVALIVVGLVLLAITTDVFGDDSWGVVWPIALIALGAWLALGWGRQARRRIPDLEVVDGLAVLSAARVATRSESFRHGSITAVVGGATLDLTEATPVPTGGVVDATAVLGSITVLVPRGWHVELRGIPLLGAWDDTTDREVIGSGAPRLTVRALVVLGGIEVKHAGRWSS